MDPRLSSARNSIEATVYLAALLILCVRDRPFCVLAAMIAAQIGKFVATQYVLGGTPVKEGEA